MNMKSNTPKNYKVVLYKGDTKEKDTAVSSENYYSVLEIESDASQEEITRAYYSLSKKYHPDLNMDNPESAEKKFLLVCEAYKILTDAKKREEYDLQGPYITKKQIIARKKMLSDFDTKLKETINFIDEILTDTSSLLSTVQHKKLTALQETFTTVRRNIEIDNDTLDCGGMVLISDIEKNKEKVKTAIQQEIKTGNFAQKIETAFKGI